MSQLIEIIRRLLIVVIWIVTIGVTVIFVVLLFTEDQKLIAALFLVGYILIGWTATKIVNWIFSK